MVKEEIQLEREGICLRPEAIIGARLDRGEVVILVDTDKLRTGSGDMECICKNVRGEYMDPKLDQKCFAPVKDDEGGRKVYPHGMKVTFPREERAKAIASERGMRELFEKYGKPMTEDEMEAVQWMVDRGLCKKVKEDE